MAEKMTKAMRDRFEYGEVERDAARARLFHPAGGWCDRMLAWCQRMAREGREDAHQRVLDESEGRRALDESTHDR